MTLPATTNLVTFVRVAETGQLRMAAKSLNLTESAISHQLSKLENLLGIRLLERGVHGARLTPEGRVYYSQISPALADIASATYAAQNRNRSKITITMPQSFASMWLAPRLHRLNEIAPEIELEILPTQRVCDLQREHIDFAIRTSRQPLQADNSTLMLQEKLTPVCTPEKVRKIESIGWQKFIASHVIILNSLHRDEWQAWSDACGYHLPRDLQYRELGSFDLVTNAVSSGLGIAMGRTPLIDTYLANGWLEQPLPEFCLRSNYYHFVWAQPVSQNSLHQQFYDWFMAEIGISNLS